jgi:ABC-type antimicrobial peptide transport system permease subunit
VAARPTLFVIRTERSSRELESRMRATIAELDPGVRYATLEPMATLIDPQTRSWTLGASMLGVFGLLALLVAAIGLYSVLTFDVAQRTRELGVRGALGATRQDLLGLVLRRALGMTAIGVTIGTLAALVLVQRLEPLLFEVPARDPLTFGSVILLLHLVAAAASAVPGWRASRVQPNEALRSE